MHWSLPVVAATLLGLPIPAPHFHSSVVTIDRNPVGIGEPVTLQWYFTGTKVTVSGGRFAAGYDVTGKTSITDRPSKTTTYYFDVGYLGQPAGAAPGAQPQPLHARYSVLVPVVDPRAMGLKPYIDPHGWTVSAMKAWQRDSVAVGDPSSNALMYFQPEDDAVERLAVSIMPFADLSSAALMDKVQADLSNHYDAPVVVSRSDITHEGLPATLLCFTGEDNAHPGTRIQSVVLAFVKSGLGYIVSARTGAREFPARASVINYMVRSFSFSLPPPETASKPPAHPPATSGAKAHSRKSASAGR